MEKFAFHERLRLGESLNDNWLHLLRFGQNNINNGPCLKWRRHIRKPFFWGWFRKCKVWTHPVVCPTVWAAKIWKAVSREPCRRPDQRFRPQTARMIELYPPEPQGRESGGWYLWPKQESLDFLTRSSFLLSLDFSPQDSRQYRHGWYPALSWQEVPPPWSET